MLWIHDQRRVEAAEPAAAAILLDVDAAEAQRGRLTQRLDRKDLLRVPLGSVGQHLLGRELARGVAKRFLVFGQPEIHARRIIKRAKSQSNKPHCSYPPFAP
jgi:hypothetical protein